MSAQPPLMRHERHYTLEQAVAVMGWVSKRVGWVRAAHDQLVALGPSASEAIASLDDQVGGSYPGRDAARALVQISRSVGELEAVDIVLRDFQRGLVDFPAMRDGIEVYLCWLVDEEDTIGFWHEPETGFAGRRPL